MKNIDTISNTSDGKDVCSRCGIWVVNCTCSNPIWNAK